MAKATEGESTASRDVGPSAASELIPSYLPVVAATNVQESVLNDECHPNDFHLDPVIACLHLQHATRSFILIFMFCCKFLQVYQFRLLHQTEHFQQ